MDLVPSSAEAKLARERAILQYVVDHVPALIFWKDTAGVYLGCNTSFAALDGRADPQELVGRTDFDMAWKAHAEQYRAGDREVIERGESILNREEPSPDGKGGEMVILTSKVPMRNELGDIIGILGIIFDITDRKQTEIDLQRAKEAAEQAVAARSQFIANVSHELRTPLTLILGPVKAALADPALSEPVRALLERVLRNGLRLYDLVNDVLDFSKADASRVKVCRQSIDAVAMLRAIVDDMQPLATTRGLSLTFESDVAELTAALDPRLLERIVLNLTGNALKYTNPGGSVRVIVSRSGDRVRIDVADTGVGIAAEDQSRLFQPFVQLDGSATRRHEGTGLGLVLVKQFADAMGGDVAVASELGKGATFTVTFPTAVDAAVHEARPDVDAELGRRTTRIEVARTIPDSDDPRTEAAGARPRILVAEDNADMRAYIIETLRDEFHVVSVPDGRAAWEQLQARTFEAVVSDVMMPELDGLRLTALIKANPLLRQVPVILLTARGGAESIASGFDAGADDYVAKPFLADELRARVRGAVRTRRLHEQLRTKARMAGMADVAASVLHNVGNVLNSVNVSAALVADKARTSGMIGLEKAIALLQAQPDPRRFLAEDPRGAALIEYLIGSVRTLSAEREQTLRELDALTDKIGHIKSIVDVQSLTRPGGGVVERFTLSDLVEDGIKLHAAGTDDATVEIVRDHGDDGTIVEHDRHKLLVILVNLLSNAWHAVKGHGTTPRITVRTRRLEGDRIEIAVTDNGVGIRAEDQAKLFGFGFSGRSGGHGFGLHSSACSALELGGALTAHSDGPGHGASFTLVVPRLRPVAGVAA